MSSTTEIISSANDLLASHAALISRIRLSQQEHRRQLLTLNSPPDELLKLPLIPSSPPSPSPPRSPSPSQQQPQIRADLPPAKRARVARYHNYVPEEETIRNDYSQRYVDGGEWPQNWVLGAEPEHRFQEYPKQQRLLNLKKASVNAHSLPPTYLPFSHLTTLNPCKFDVVLLDPPFSSSFTWDHLQDLPIPSLAADPSFVFLWVGSGAGEGLERGREVLAKWGYRRCEDVVWVKTNKTSNRGPGTDPPTTSLLTRTKQHCLIGIRGTVRRSTDSWFVHCNVDTDVIIWEGDPLDPTRKPPEMYTLIENFCLGTRRLEIFGKESSSLRRGWVTVLGGSASIDGEDISLPDSMPVPFDEASAAMDSGESVIATRWEKEIWENGIRELAGSGGGVGSGNGGKPVVPMTAEIDALRPKSPFRPGQQQQGGQGGGSGPRFNSSGGGDNRGNMGISNFAGNVGMGGQGQAQNANQMMGMGMGPMMGMNMAGMQIPMPMNMMGGNEGMGMGGWPGGMGMMYNGISMPNMGMMPMMGNMGQMGLGGNGAGFQGHGHVQGQGQNQSQNQSQNAGGGGGGGGGGGAFLPGMAMFNPGQNMGWAEQGQGQGQFAMGMDGDPLMAMSMGGGVDGHGGMNMGGMGMGQWNQGYEGY